jgi:hypothetical protein
MKSQALPILLAVTTLACGSLGSSIERGIGEGIAA